MPLALFDLDNTLLGGDSDHAWGEFLVRMARVDGALYQRQNDQFLRDYHAGHLDIDAYLRFALAPLAALARRELDQLHARFMAEVVSTLILPKALALLARHRAAGDRLVVITATNRFVVQPICARLGVAEVIATEPEQVDGRYTGVVLGVPCYREGKVVRLREWLAATAETLAGSYFYSDSSNDLPLLELVDNPVAVDPDPHLDAVARATGWPVISLR